jgi:hypothetical protein
MIFKFKLYLDENTISLNLFQLDIIFRVMFGKLFDVLTGYIAVGRDSDTRITPSSSSGYHPREKIQASDGKFPPPQQLYTSLVLLPN